MPGSTAPIPLQTPLSEERPGPIGRVHQITQKWARWLVEVTTRLDKSPEVLGKVGLTNQSAAIGTTAVAIGSLPTGRYRISYYARVTTPASTSSSLTVTLGWTDGGVSCSVSGVAMTGNTTNTVQSGSVVVNADQATGITYATAYSSSGATPMKYALTVIVEALP